MKKLTVTEKYNKKKLCKFILDSFPHLSTNMLYKALRQKDIKINGIRTNKDCIIYSGDEILVYIADNLLFPTINLNIIYEDDNILITVNQKEVTVSAIAQTIEVGGSFKTEPIVVGSGSQNPTISTIVTGISGETAALEGALTITAKTTVPGEYSNAITQGTVSFKDNDKFLAKNYKMIFKAGKAIVKRTIDSDDTDDIVLEIDGAETEDGKYIYNGVDYADVQEIKVKIKP